MNNIKVSNAFVDIYKKINIIDQRNNMSSLSKRELYLLILLSLDKIKSENKAFYLNIGAFRYEGENILKMIQNEKVCDQTLLDLMMETDKYINIHTIVDENGDSLPPPLLDKSEIRNFKIDIINQ